VLLSCWNVNTINEEANGAQRGLGQGRRVPEVGRVHTPLIHISRMARRTRSAMDLHCRGMIPQNVPPGRRRRNAMNVPPRRRRRNLHCSKKNLGSLLYTHEDDAAEARARRRGALAESREGPPGESGAGSRDEMKVKMWRGNPSSSRKRGVESRGERTPEEKRRGESRGGRRRSLSNNTRRGSSVTSTMDGGGRRTKSRADDSS